MLNSLYPLKFTPRIFHKLWGGQTIRKWYSNVPSQFENVGESWLISAVDKFPTEVCNGPLAGNELADLLEVYMDELVGNAVYERFGNTFPLLFKFIDAADDLSIQVHPDDENAWELEQSMGKTEMWYVMPSDENASVIAGWKTPMDEAQIRDAIRNGSLAERLVTRPVKEGDAVMIHAGLVHALNRGTIVAEIQENSDITYRLFDYDRVGNDGLKRPLKLDHALRVMNFEQADPAVISHHEAERNQAANIVSTDYFTTNIIRFDKPVARDYAPLDSFVVYMCVRGACEVEAPEADGTERVQRLQLGEALLLPAILNDITLRPTTGECRLLEIYIDKIED